MSRQPGEEMLLTTKLFIPRPRPNWVARPRLLQRLDQTLQPDHKLTVVAAPPGSGKTTLLASWIAGLPAFGSPPDVAWLSLDAADNAPHRFFKYCIAALQTVDPTLERPPLQSAETLLAPLINGLAARPRPLVFVLDDYHLIHSRLIHAAVEHLLDNLPPDAHLVIASRTELPLPLARLRVRGQLAELGRSDLRFSGEEAAAFLGTTMGLHLSPADVAALEDRTEGWVAGLQMAALSLQNQPPEDASRRVQDFSGRHHFVMDYLLEEVLRRQPSRIQQFLLTTAIFERFCGPLADAVLDDFPDSPAGGAPGADVLRRLEQANLFIVPLDDRRYWYRYHHLFADLLRHRLTRQNTDLPALHRRAAEWFEQNNLPAEAMEHAMAAGDVTRVVRLARQKAAALLSRAELVTLLSWLDALPEPGSPARPGVSLLRAWGLLLTGQFEAVEHHLQTAAPEPAEFAIPGEVETLRATVAYFRRDMPQAEAGYRQALELLPPDNLFLRGCVVQSLGAAQSWLGRVTQAIQSFAESAALNRAAGNLPVTLVAQWNLARLYAEQGQWWRAAETCRAGIKWLAGHSAAVQDSLRPFAGPLHLTLAEACLQWNQVEQAARHTETGLQLGRDTQETATLIQGLLLQAQLAHLSGDDPVADAALAQAEQQAQRHGGSFYWPGRVAVQRARLQLARGNLPAVVRWVQAQGLQFNPPPDSISYLLEDAYLLLVRLLLAQFLLRENTVGLPVARPLEVAERVLAAMRNAAQPAGRNRRVLELWVVQARVLWARQQPAEALAVLEQALSLAAPEDARRIFLDEGAEILPLLHRAAAQNIARNFAGRLLTDAGQSLPGIESLQLLDPLSERELEILSLIADGLSNKELAEKLALTVGTVKWHLNNIYSKLAVRSRTQAVAKARELGLV